jgi:hypothetical protein
MIDTQNGKVRYKEMILKPMGCCVPENGQPLKPEDLIKIK